MCEAFLVHFRPTSAVPNFDNSALDKFLFHTYYFDAGGRPFNGEVPLRRGARCIRSSWRSTFQAFLVRASPLNQLQQHNCNDFAVFDNHRLKCTIAHVNSMSSRCLQAFVAVTLLAGVIIAAVAISFHSGTIYTNWLEGTDTLGNKHEAVHNECAESFHAKNVRFIKIQVFSCDVCSEG